MTEGSDETIDVADAAAMPNTDVDTDLYDWIRDAAHRLIERVYVDYDEITVHLGESAWRRLGGDSWDVTGKSMSIDGMPVLRNLKLPDDRIMLVAEDALRDVSLSSRPRLYEDPGEVPIPDPEPATFDVEGQAINRVEAIEFVPEAEVFYDD